MKKTMNILAKVTALLLLLCLLPLAVTAEEVKDDKWESFLLICNEGMNNDKGNAGNTLMVAAMEPDQGRIHLMMFTWDTFIDYEGYDLPQKIDMPYRNNGPEETLRVFNDNFGLNIEQFMSLNYLNLATLIDDYGGVEVDITRAERNALNGMVSSKKENILAQADLGILSQMVIDMLAQEYYLTEYGPNTHLNGLQAVGFGWLQYDSVYNCCLREISVVAALFKSVGNHVNEDVIFYNDESGMPEMTDGRRPINIDALTEEDIAFLRREISPIIQTSYNNLPEEEIIDLTTTLAKVAYAASRQGVNIFDSLQYRVFPLEALDPYDIVAGAKGHVIDTNANREAILEFLYSEN